MTDPLLHIARLSLQFGRVSRATFHEDGTTPESDTDHTVMLSWLALDIASRHPELGLDLGRLAILASVHDAPEAHAGDTNTAGGLTPEAAAEKAARESAAIERIRADVGGPLSDWIDVYERQACPESRFLKYADKITPKLTQALNGCVQFRRDGVTVEQLRERHRVQGATLAARYPEFATVLGPIFDAACAASEAALASAPALTNCHGCAHDYTDIHGGPRCRIIDAENDDATLGWAERNTGEDGHPVPGATNCPGFSARKGAA